MPDVNGITLEEAQNALVEAMAARSAFLGGAKGVKSYSYSSGGNERTVTREDLKSINEDIIFWDAKVRQLSRGGIVVRGVTFLP
jgi:hypothetical protein